MDDEAEEVEEAEASDAEDETLGQKVLLQACISVGEHCQHWTTVKHAELATYPLIRPRSMSTLLSMLSPKT